MTPEIKLLGPDDATMLDRVERDVFDEDVRPHLAREFLSDKRHHIIVARDAGIVIGMITAVDYIHPDKPAQLWINEVGVAPAYQRRGIGRRLLDAMLVHARALGCTEAWLGTEEDNVAARRLYESSGGAFEKFALYTFNVR